MKLPPSYLNGSGRALEKSRRVLDMAVSKKTVHVDLSSRSFRSLSVQPKVAFKKHDLDGIQREKRAFLAQLKEHSYQDALWRLFRKWEIYFRLFKRSFFRFVPSFTPHKMLYGSLIGGVAFGMVSMAFMEHFFGPGVFARSQSSSQEVVVASAETVPATPDGAADYSDMDIFSEYFNEATDAQYQETVRNMVKGYPIEAMLPYIFQQDRLTSAFLIGIAKKESNWGKRVPVLDGQDCFNYWGYRGIRRMMGTGGHTCFNSSKDAVQTVAKRLTTLIQSEKLNTPEKMIVWKCGFSCQGHSRESVKKWISDVDMYFSQLSDE